MDKVFEFFRIREKVADLTYNANKKVFTYRRYFWTKVKVLEEKS